MIEGTIYEMHELAGKKHDCLKAMLDIKSKQKEAIEKEDIDSIESTIDMIQNQINIIDAQDLIYKEKFNELKGNMKIETINQIDCSKYPYITSLKNSLDEIESILKAIKVTDDENNLLMNEKFEESKGRLKNLRQSQKMTRGYFTDYNETIFIDERN